MCAGTTRRLGRMAVLPSFNCSAPWIKKRIAADGQLVVADLRGIYFVKDLKDEVKTLNKALAHERGDIFESI